MRVRPQRHCFNKLPGVQNIVLLAEIASGHLIEACRIGKDPSKHRSVEGAAEEG